MHVATYVHSNSFDEQADVGDLDTLITKTISVGSKVLIDIQFSSL